MNEAPPFSSVAGEFASFVGAAPVVGHNIGFDLGFLDAEGLKLSNPRCDTWDLAYVMRPGLPEYSLSRLACHHVACFGSIINCGVIITGVSLAVGVETTLTVTFSV